MMLDIKDSCKVHVAPFSTTVEAIKFATGWTVAKDEVKAPKLLTFGAERCPLTNLAEARELRMFKRGVADILWECVDPKASELPLMYVVAPSKQTYAAADIKANSLKLLPFADEESLQDAKAWMKKNRRASANDVEESDVRCTLQGKHIFLSDASGTCRNLEDPTKASETTFVPFWWLWTGHGTDADEKANLIVGEKVVKGLKMPMITNGRAIKKGEPLLFKVVEKKTKVVGIREREGVQDILVPEPKRAKGAAKGSGAPKSAPKGGAGTKGASKGKGNKNAK